MRCRYVKTGKLRFVSAIDLGRLWERALRKAELPIAYSEGFSPHPRISFPDALPLGYASTGEYAELTFAAPVSVEAVTKGLNRAFPEGLAVLVAAGVADDAPRLSRWLRAALWDLRYPDGCEQVLEAATSAAREAATLTVERERKGQRTEIDLRPQLAAVACAGTTVGVTLHHAEPAVRPSEVHLALRACEPTDTPPGARALPEPTLVTRVAQGSAVDAGLVEALTGDLLPVDPHGREPREDDPT